LNDFSTLIGGIAGDGINEAGLTASRLLSRLGCSIYMYYDYPSLIRGGHNFSLIRACRGRVLAHTDAVDVLIALNQETVEKHQHRLKESSFVIYDADKVRPEALAVTLDGIHGRISTPVGPVQLDSALLGDYNVENLLCAIGAAIALDVPVAAIEGGLAGAAGVPGRLERVANQRGAVALVDYAHTGDALDRVLQALAALDPERIITVFGCGGDRDPRKRPVMGEVAARRSDVAVVTSDNPRTEDPLRIIDQVCQGVERVHARAWTLTEAASGQGRGYVVLPDRRAAIRFAVGLLRPRDVLLVAGKGHEDYQILGTTRIHFDDREELREAFAQGDIA
jgi:UDP-N-acetylmuramoyl-L-alanyl-D-glutamate--2,6-diaminopimelate ligase